MIEMLFIAVVLLIATITDIKKREIPNKLILISAAFSTAIGIYRGPRELFVRSIAALALFIFLYLVVYRLNLLPGGDIKALVLILFTVGTRPFATMLSYIAICTIPVFIYYWIKREKTIPFALPMFMASLIMLGIQFGGIYG